MSLIAQGLYTRRGWSYHSDMRVDMRDIKRFMRKLGNNAPKAMMTALRSAGNLLRREIRKDYSGRVLRRRTGRLARQVRVKAFRRQGDWWTKVYVGQRGFYARFHETGAVLRTRWDAKRQRMVPLKTPIVIPAQRIFERQRERQLRPMMDEIKKGLHQAILKAHKK